MTKEPLYETLAAALIEQIEQGNAPWQKTFPSGVQFLPFNPSNGSTYHGINVIQLLAQNREDPRWMAYKQARELGGQVRSGEEGTKVQYWKFTEEQKITIDGQEQTRKVDLKTPEVFYATVFNAEQIDNLPALEIQKIEPNMQGAENCIGQISVENDLQASKSPYYARLSDVVHLPPKNDTLEFYQAALYQAAKWTSHPDRMDRDIGPSGSRTRVIEELRCQIATMIVGSSLGIGYMPSSMTQGATASSLVEHLKENPVEIFRAASQAEKIASHLLDMCHGKEIFAKSQIQQTLSEKVYLAVPYGERNAAKALGAKWDPQEKSWYSEGKETTKKLERWLSENQEKQQKSSLPPREELSALMKEIGFELEGDHPIMDGKPYRARIMGDNHGEVGGFYVAHSDGHPNAYVKNNRTNIELRWKAKGYVISEEQKAALKADAAQKRQEREQSREKEHQAALQKIEQQIESSTRVERSDYLDRKGIKATEGVRISQYNSLIVPAYDAAGKLQTVQYINEDGTKRFAKEARREGSFHPIDGFSQIQKSNVIVIAEGYATANSIASASDKNVAIVAALSAGNLEAVAVSLCEKFPDKQIVVAADRDQVGLETAEKAAKAVNGSVIVPSFSQADLKNNSSLNDFNDLQILQGTNELKIQLSSVMEAAKETLNTKATHKEAAMVAER